jgi:hypothetical protein
MLGHRSGVPNSSLRRRAQTRMLCQSEAVMCLVVNGVPGQPAVRAYSGPVALGFFDLVCAVRSGGSSWLSPGCFRPPHAAIIAHRRQRIMPAVTVLHIAVARPCRCHALPVLLSAGRRQAPAAGAQGGSAAAAHQSTTAGAWLRGGRVGQATQAGPVATCARCAGGGGHEVTGGVTERRTGAPVRRVDRRDGVRHGARR